MNKKEVNKNEKRNKKELGIFLKTHVIPKTKILFIIGVIIAILTAVLFSVFDVSLVNENETIEKAGILSVLKDRVLKLILILVAGWVPYCYIPAIVYVAYVFILSGDLIFNMQINNGLITLLINVIPSLIDIFIASIITAVGLYISNYSTRKYKYNQKRSFSFQDVKIQLYQMTKKQDKYEEEVAKKGKKLEGLEKNNVNIDYKMIFKIAPILIGINLLICVLQYIIN